MKQRQNCSRDSASPSHGFCVLKPTAAPTNAPKVIIPSIPTLTTPELSEITPPIAPKISGAEYISIVFIIERILFSIFFTSLRQSVCNQRRNPSQCNKKQYRTNGNCNYFGRNAQIHLQRISTIIQCTEK